MHAYQLIIDNDEFMTARKKGLGGSDIVTLLGYNRQYTRKVGGHIVQQTPLLLWKEKRGEVEPFSGNNQTEWGKRLEPAIIDGFIEDHNLDTWAKMTRFIHPDFSWAFSHPDLLYNQDGEWKLLEVKTTQLFSSIRRDDIDYGYSDSDFSENGIPASVDIQVQWQLFTADLNEATVAVLINTSDYREYGPIRRNEYVFNHIYMLAKAFWGLVTSGIAPDPETYSDTKIVFPRIEKTKKVIAGDDIYSVKDMLSRLAEIKKIIKDFENDEELIKKKLAVIIGDSQLLTDSDGAIYARQSEHDRSSISLSDLKKKDKEIYWKIEKYINITKVRRLSI